MAEAVNAPTARIIAFFILMIGIEGIDVEKCVEREDVDVDETCLSVEEEDEKSLKMRVRRCF